MKASYIILVLLSAYVLSFGQDKSGPVQPAPIIYIYDASGSMWGQMEGSTKMEIASRVLAESVRDFAENQPLGLVAYGHRKKGDCRDVENLVPMSNQNKELLIQHIQALKPLGKTPLAYSASLVIDQLRATKEKATIVLITDGIESCDGNICEVVRRAKEEGIDFKLHIVGFGLKDGETEQLKCAAEAGDGHYYDAADASGLGEAMTEVAAQTVDKPKGNLGVYVTKDGKAIDADIQAYLAGTENQADYARTYKDTTFLYLPQASYDLKVWQHGFNAISPLIIKGVKTSNETLTYQMVSLDGGKLRVSVSNNGALWDSQVGIKTVAGERVTGGRTYAKAKEFELDAGRYQIEVSARDMHGLETTYTLTEVAVGNGETAEVSHDFSSGKAILGATYQGEAFDAHIKVEEVKSGKTVYAFRTRKRNLGLTLNPGSYQVSFTEPGVYNSSAKSASFIIQVKKGETITKMGEVK